MPTKQNITKAGHFKGFGLCLPDRGQESKKKAMSSFCWTLGNHSLAKQGGWNNKGTQTHQQTVCRVRSETHFFAAQFI